MTRISRARDILFEICREMASRDAEATRYLGAERLYESAKTGIVPDGFSSWEDLLAHVLMDAVDRYEGLRQRERLFEYATTVSRVGTPLDTLDAENWDYLGMAYNHESDEVVVLWRRPVHQPLLGRTP